MGVSYYTCGMCQEIFNDCGDYGYIDPNEIYDTDHNRLYLPEDEANFEGWEDEGEGEGVKVMTDEEMIRVIRSGCDHWCGCVGNTCSIFVDKDHYDDLVRKSKELEDLKKTLLPK
jgi:hypothetical protein